MNVMLFPQKKMKEFNIFKSAVTIKEMSNKEITLDLISIDILLIYHYKFL